MPGLTVRSWEPWPRTQPPNSALAIHQWRSATHRGNDEHQGAVGGATPSDAPLQELLAGSRSHDGEAAEFGISSFVYR